MRLITYFDGSYELEYEYDFIKTNEFDPLFYSITIEREVSLKEAEDLYRFGKKTILTVNNMAGFERVEIDSVPISGDSYYYALRYVDGRPNGVLFMLRRGKAIYTLITSGLYSTDHSLITDLILPDIKNLEKLNLSN